MVRIKSIQLPKKPNGRGYPRIKRSYGIVGGVFVGQINVSSGTDNPKEYQNLVAMLDLLYERGEGAVLARIRDSVKRGNQNRPAGRHYEIQEVYRLLKAKKHIPNILGTKPLDTALSDWLKSAQKKTGIPLAERTIKSYSVNIKQLMDFNHGVVRLPAPTDADIPALLSKYREWCADAKRQFRVPFNQVRTMLRSYARETQSEREDSDLYRAIRRIPSLSSKRKRDRKALEVWQVLEAMSKFPPREAQHLWNMCALSVRPDEYALGQWRIVRDSPYGDYIEVAGSKTENAARVVPLAKGVVKDFYVDSTFRRHFRKVFAHEYQPRDFRSTGRQWLKRAGIDPSRVRMYFGHSMNGMEHRYDTHELLPFLARDAQLLNQYIDANRIDPRKSGNGSE